MKKLLLMPLVFLALFVSLLCSCDLYLEYGEGQYKFFYLAPSGFTIITDNNFQYIHPNTNLKMFFDANLITTAEMTFEPSELNEYLISKTNEYNIREWEIESVNDGFEFVGTSFD